MTAALELLTSQERARAAARRDPQDHDAGQSAKAPTDEPLVTMLMIELDPGASQPPHLHPGPIFSYVLEGELLFQCHGTEKVTYEEGDVFWEPGIDRPHLVESARGNSNRCGDWGHYWDGSFARRAHRDVAPWTDQYARSALCRRRNVHVFTETL